MNEHSPRQIAAREVLNVLERALSIAHQRPGALPATRKSRVHGETVDIPIFYACTFCHGAVATGWATPFRDVTEITREQWEAAPPCTASLAEQVANIA